MKKKIKKLTKEQITLMERKFEKLTFESDFDIVYGGQVPVAGLILLKGKMSYLKMNKISGNIPSGALIGVYQLIHDIPAETGARVSSNSELILIHKSEIMDALIKKNSELYEIIKNFVV